MSAASTRAPKRAPHVRNVNIVIIVLGALLSFVLLGATESAMQAYQAMHSSSIAYLQCDAAAQSLKDASTYLTTTSRLFTITHDPDCVRRYYEEIEVTRRRDEALDVLGRYAEEAEASVYLELAFAESNELAQLEGRAMRLCAESLGLPLEGDLAPLANFELSEAELALSPEEQEALAQDLLFDNEYQTKKDYIDQNVEFCSSELVQKTYEGLEESDARLAKLLQRERLLTTLLLVTVVATILLVMVLALWPIDAYSKSIAKGEALKPQGSQELRDLAFEYNQLYEENRKRSDHLRHKADHDPLTGLFNRGAYDELVSEHTSKVALMLVDVDYFKHVNDTYGHAVGDQILQKVANSLAGTFRTSDYACRIGGDEFAVIITGMEPQLRRTLEEKIGRIQQELADVSDGLPAITLSIGVAFSDAWRGELTLLEAADQALYEVKEGGRNGYAFYRGISGNASAEA